MDGETIIGCLVALAALVTITFLVLWSRRRIDRIARRTPRSARETLKELRSD